MRYIRTLLILHAFVVLANGSTQDLNPATADIDTVVSWIGSHVSSISSTESSRRAYEYAYIVLRRCHQLSSYQHIAKVHQHLATYHYMQVASEQTDSIIYHDSLAMVNFRLAGDRSGAAKSLAYLASSYLLVNRFQEAEANLFEALGIFRELDDQDEVAGTLSDLSDYFIATESYEDAIKYAEQAEEVLSKSDDARSYGIALFSIVPAHVKLEQYVVAMEKADLAVEKVTSVSDIDSAALAKALGAKALVHQKIGDLDQALSDYMRAWDIVKTLVNEEHEADGWKQGVAEVLYLQQKYAEAIPYYEDYITHLKRRKNKGNLWQTQLELADCYEQLHQSDQALALFKEGANARNGMKDDKIATLNNELQIRYETSAREAQIAQQGETISRQTRIQWLTSIILGMLAIASAIGWWVYRRLKNQKTELEVLNQLLGKKVSENELLLKEIHHRVKNNLQIISSLLSLQSRAVDDASVKNAILDSESRVRSMSLIHKKLYTGDDLAVVEMKSYFENLANHLVDAYADIDDEVAVELSMEEFELDVKYAVPLGLIANELVTNSLKYAAFGRDAGKIEICLTKSGEDLLFSVKDNGHLGTAESKEKDEDSGFGTSLVRMLTEQLHGEIEQKPQEGYWTQIRFPLAKVAA